MLAFSIKRYLPTRLGIITLDCGEFGYLYVGQKAYNSGVLLSQSVLDKGFNYVEQHMKPASVEERPSVKEFYDKLPNPIKPLALLLYNTEKEYTKFEEQVGVLNIILQSIFPTAYFNTPKNQRITYSFGPSIEAEYRYDWKNFFDSCIDYDTLTNPKDSKETHPIFVISAEQVVDGNPFRHPEPPRVEVPKVTVPEPVPVPKEEPTVKDEEVKEVEEMEETNEPQEINEEITEEIPEVEEISGEDFLEQMLREE